MTDFVYLVMYGPKGEDNQPDLNEFWMLSNVYFSRELAEEECKEGNDRHPESSYFFWIEKRKIAG